MPTGLLNLWPKPARRFLQWVARTAIVYAAAAAPPALADGLPVRLGDGLTLNPYILYQLDEAGFAESRPGGQAAGFNARRLRTGARLDLQDQAEIGLIWDFGHTPGSTQRLFEAQATYSGLKPFAFTAGIFKPSFGLESMQGAGATLFLERASISTITRNIAAGIEREAIQARATGERYHLALALTAGTSGPGRDGDQRAVVARAVGVPVRTDSLLLHLGASGEWVFRPPRAAGALPALSLSDQPELRIDDVAAALSTGSIPTRSAGAIGAEFGLGAGRLWMQGEWYQVLVDRRLDAGGGTLGFTGGYLQAAYTLLGKPRAWDGKSAAWGNPRPDAGFNPASGQFGALEIGARFSTADLNSLDVRGGRQRVWTVGANWFPWQPIRVALEYEHADIDGGPSPRSLDAIAARAQLNF